MATPPSLTTAQQTLITEVHYWSVFQSGLHGDVLITISIEGPSAPAGQETYLQCSDPGFRLRRGRQSVDDIYVPIQRSDAELYLHASDSGAFDDLFDIQDDQLVTNWRGVVHIYTGPASSPSLYWQGLLEDDLWEDQPETPVDVITLRAGDGLAHLQDETVAELSRGERLSLADRILEVLQVVRPDMTSLDYNTDLTLQGETEDILDSLRVTLRSEEDPDGRQGPYDDGDTLFSVLEDLLVSGCARIYQEEGAFKVRQAMAYSSPAAELGPIEFRQGTSRQGVRKLQTASVTERWADADVNLILNGGFENTVSGDSLFWDQGAPWTAELYDNTPFTIDPSDGDQRGMYAPEVSTENDYSGAPSVKQKHLATLPQSTQDQTLELRFDVGVSSDDDFGSIPPFQDPLNDRSDYQDQRSFAGPVDVEVTAQPESGGDTYKLFYAFGQLGLDGPRRFPLKTTARKLEGDDVKVPIDFEPTDLPTAFQQGTLLIPEGYTAVVRRGATGTGGNEYAEWDEITFSRPFSIGDDHVYLDLEESLEQGTLIGFYVWAKNPSITGEQSSIQANNFPVPITPQNDSLTELEATVPLHTPSGESVQGSISLEFRRGNFNVVDDSSGRKPMSGATVIDDVELTAEGVDSKQSGTSQPARGRSWQYESKIGSGPIGIDRSFGDETAVNVQTAEAHQIAYFDGVIQYQPEYRIDGAFETRTEYLTRQILERQGRTTERRIHSLYPDSPLSPSTFYSYDDGTYHATYIEERIGSQRDIATIELLQHTALDVPGSQVATFLQTRNAVQDGIDEIVRPLIFQTAAPQNAVAGGVPQANVNYSFESRSVDGAANWSDLSGTPSSIYTRDSEAATGTIQLTDAEIISQLGYTPFDEAGGDILGSVEVQDDMSVQGSLFTAETLEVMGDTILGGDIEVAGDIVSPYISDPTLAGDVQVSGTLTAQNDVTVQGSLTVLGTRFEADVQTVEISDNLAVINSGETGSGVTAGFSGWRVDRGTAEDYEFGFDEGRDRFVVGKTTKQVVATREDSPVDTGLAFYNTNSNRFETTDQVTWDGSVLQIGTGSTKISNDDVDTGSILFDNKEQADFSESGRLFWDASAGLYLKSANAPNATDTSPARLLWSGDNVKEGKNIDLLYDFEDRPTVRLQDSIDLAGTLDVQGEVSTSDRFALRSGSTARFFLRIEDRFGESDDTVELNIRDKTGSNVADLLRVDTEGSDTVDANLNWSFRRALTLQDRVGTDHYAAQQTGWRVLHNGEADFRNIYADELTVQTFTAELTQSLAGSDILTKSAADLSEAYTGGNNLKIETPPEASGYIFGLGDTLRLRTVDRSEGGLSVADVWLWITNRVSEDGDVQAYNVEVKDEPTGSYTIHKGARVLDYGSSGDTIIERTVNGPGSPFDRIVKWTDTTGNKVPDTYNTISQVGNISDQTDADVGIYTESGRFTDDIRIGDTDGSYLEFDGSLTIVTAQHGDLDSAISTIQTDVSDNAASISAVASTQSDQGDAISALEIDVSDNADGISANSSLISQLDTDLGTVESGLQTQIDANETDISSNLSAINSVQTDLGNVESGLQSQIDANDSDISSNLGLINDLETDTSNLSAGLELLTTTGQQNLLQYVLTESGLTATYEQTGGSNSSVVTALGTFSLDDLNVEAGDTISYSFEGSFEDPQDEGGFVGPLVQFKDASGDTITYVSDNDAPRGNRISLDTGGEFEFAYAEGIVIPDGTETIRFYINSNSSGNNQIYRGRYPMLVRGETAVGFAYDQQAMAAFNLSAENESGLASVEGRVTDNEATLDLTVSYDDQTAGIFLTADGDGTALELDADQILLSGSVTADSIAADTITSDEIAAGTITADEITVDELAALNATIGGFDIANGSISATVNGVQIALGSTDPGTTWGTSVRGLQVGADGDNRLWIGELNGDYEFSVREDGDYLVQFGSRGNYIEGELLVSGSVTADAIAAGTITADRLDVIELSALDATIGGWRIYDNNIAADNNDLLLGSEFGLRLRATDSSGERNAITWRDIDSTGTLLAESFIQGRGADLYYSAPDGGHRFRGREFRFQPPADYGTSEGEAFLVKMLVGLSLQDLPTSVSNAAAWEVYRDGDNLKVKVPDTEQPPTADLRVQSKDGLEVTFDASDSFSAAGAGLEYRFKFEDTGSYTAWQFEPEIVHTYPSEGEYTATVEVRDQDNNEVDQDSTTLNVSTSSGGGGGGANDDNDSSIAF